MLEFDADGNLLNAWGGPGYVPSWPREQTINVDAMGTSGSLERSEATAS